MGALASVQQVLVALTLLKHVVPRVYYSYAFTIPTLVVCLISQVPAFNGQCRSGSYCHVSLGHTTAMATATFFGASELKSRHTSSFGGTVGEGKETKATAHGSEDGLSLDEVACLRFPWEAEFVQQAKLVGRAHVASDDPFATADVEECAQQDGQNDEGDALQYCHLSFHTPVIAPENSVVVGSRLDTSGLALTNTSATGRLPGSGTGDSQCRIAFHGRLVAPAAGNSKTPGDAGAGIEFGTEAGQVKLFTEKLKTGVVARMGADTNAAVQTGDMIDVYGKDLFKKETNMSPFAGMILLSEVCLNLRYNIDSGPSTAPVCASRNYRHHSGNSRYSAYCHYWWFPSFPSDFTCTSGKPAP